MSRKLRHQSDMSRRNVRTMKRDRSCQNIPNLGKTQVAVCIQLHAPVTSIKFHLLLTQK